MMGWDDDRLGYNNMHNSGFSIVMMVFAIILIAFFALLLFRLASGPRHLGGHLAAKLNGPSPLEVIDMRLAKGEISKDDYIVAKELLDKK